MRSNNVFSGLFWKLSLTFLFLLTGIGFAYLIISTRMSEEYFIEKNQRLNASIAKSIVKEVKPFINGELSEDATDAIMHHLMAVNPSIEVYLLDAQGKILNYVAPDKKVVADRVRLEPINKFLTNYEKGIIVGDDPRNPGVEKVFSAAEIKEGNKIVGYVYVILASEEYDSVTDMLQGNYILRLGTTTMLVTLLAAFIIGLLAFWIVTKNINRIITTVKKFQEGEFSARIPVKNGGEINNLALAFNDMADTIVGNIENMKSMEKLRRELVGNVSHDLRTPLAIIHGYIETLIMKNNALDDSEREKYLNTALESTERLRKLVDELFELSKLEAKQIRPNKEPFFIDELIHDVVRKFNLIANNKGIKLKAKVLHSGITVNADVSLIERVLQNLVDNAIKYTPENGEITLEVDETSDTVQIKVTDTGAGIPEDQAPYIFDRYHIGDKRVSLDKNSTGLGLAIVKRILEIHNVNISLLSNHGRGTTFQFNLPKTA